MVLPTANSANSPTAPQGTGCRAGAWSRRRNPPKAGSRSRGCVPQLPSGGIDETLAEIETTQGGRTHAW